MNNSLKFWKRKTDTAPVEEPVKERGYFESVASPDVTVRNIAAKAQTVEGPEMAMKLATVYRCVSILSGSIASLPLQVKRKKNGVFMVDELFSKLFNHCILLYINYLIRQNNHSIQ